MSMLGNLFRRKNNVPEDTAQQQRFADEWKQAIERFGIVTGLGAINVTLPHPKTGLLMSPHEGLNQSFSKWKTIQSPYDRRVLFFDLIYQTVYPSMNHWQTANYMVATRLPHEALPVLDQAPNAETASAQYHAARARALLHLDRPADALVHARQSAELAPDDTRIRALLADALHLSGQGEEAHAIYHDLMAAASPVPEGSDPITLMFALLFSQETGVVRSPVLALDIVKHMGDEAQADAFWRLGEVEFYDNPYFRMHHAYYLIDSGEFERGCGKLLALVREMPWLREASLNLLACFKKLDPSGQRAMPEFQEQLRQTIQKNGWTSEGMREIVLGTGR